MADVDLEGIINQAARSAGLPLRIEQIFEGSDLSKVALELYSQCRDELLDAKDWSFNRHTAPLTLLKGPPPNGGYSIIQPWSELYPAPGWLYEFGYPTDAVDIRAIIPPPLGIMPDTDPLPAEWRVDNDSTPNIGTGVPTGPPAKVIYCNVTDALAVYRSRVTDPAIFDPGFVAALVALLGKRFAVAFGAGVEVAKEQMSEAAVVAQQQSDVRG